VPKRLGECDEQSVCRQNFCRKVTGKEEGRKETLEKLSLIRFFRDKKGTKLPWDGYVAVVFPRASSECVGRALGGRTFWGNPAQGGIGNYFRRHAWGLQYTKKKKKKSVIPQPVTGKRERKFTKCFTFVEGGKEGWVANTNGDKLNGVIKNQVTREGGELGKLRPFEKASK